LRGDEVTGSDGEKGEVGKVKRGCVLPFSWGTENSGIEGEIQGEKRTFSCIEGKTGRKPEEFLDEKGRRNPGFPLTERGRNASWKN